MRLFVLILLVWLGLSSSSWAQTVEDYSPPDVSQEVPLEGAPLKALFDDVLHRGYYDFLNRPDGDYSFTEMMNSDGTSLHVRDGEEMIGQWRIMANVVCFEYGDIGGGCFTFYQRGNCNYIYSVVSREFIAVSVTGDQAPSCEPSVA